MSTDVFLWFMLWLAAGLGGYILFFWHRRFVEPTETPPSVLFRIIALVAIISGPILLMVALLTRLSRLINIARGLPTGGYRPWNGLRGAKVEPRLSPKPAYVRGESSESDTSSMSARTNYLAIASLVLGIVSTLLWVGAFSIFFDTIVCFSVIGFSLGAAAFITGLIGYLQVKKSDGAQRGTWIAVVGMSLAVLQLALGCLLLALLAFMLSVYGVL